MGLRRGREAARALQTCGEKRGSAAWFGRARPPAPPRPARPGAARPPIGTGRSSRGGTPARAGQNRPRPSLTDVSPSRTQPLLAVPIRSRPRPRQCPGRGGPLGRGGGRVPAGTAPTLPQWDPAPAPPPSRSGGDGALSPALAAAGGSLQPPPSPRQDPGGPGIPSLPGGAGWECILLFPEKLSRECPTVLRTARPHGCYQSRPLAPELCLTATLLGLGALAGTAQRSLPSLGSHAVPWGA